jgi:mono/diheme cytochrome c family protein
VREANLNPVEGIVMKTKLVVVSTAATAFLLACGTSWAASDGAALYKSRCSNCHGTSGEGKTSMKAPALKGTTMSADDLQQFALKGAAGKKGPHGKGISKLKDDQAKAIADYVKTL